MVLFLLWGDISIILNIFIQLTCPKMIYNCSCFFSVGADWEENDDGFTYWLPVDGMGHYMHISNGGGVLVQLIELVDTSAPELISNIPQTKRWYNPPPC